MVVYTRTYDEEVPQEVTMSFSEVERPVYGSSRIANYVDSVQLVSLDESISDDYVYYDGSDILAHNNGTRHFELTNHLGNVMAVVTDARLPVLDATSTAIESFQPELLLAKDYYPFGMEMSGRYDISNPEPIDVGYRYGFNGMEKDDEITGHTDRGNHYTATFWEYDSRIGRRWNLDPKPQTSISDYACFADNPIFYIDPNGDKFDKASKKHLKEYKKQTRQRMNEVKDRMKDPNEDIEALSIQMGELQDAKKELKMLKQSKTEFRIRSVDNESFSAYDQSEDAVYIVFEGRLSEWNALAHEMRHAYGLIIGELSYNKNSGFIYSNKSTWESALLKQPGVLYEQTDEVVAFRRDYAFQSKEAQNAQWAPKINTIKDIDVTHEGTRLLFLNQYFREYPNFDRQKTNYNDVDAKELENQILFYEE